MPFIGKPPAVGAYSVLDALTASATANYSLQLNGAAFVPNSVNQLLVSLNGVIQKPGSSFVVSGSTLTFKNGGSDQALTSSDSIDFIISMGGDPLNVGIVSDGTITNSKVANGIASSKLSGALPAIDGSALTGSVGNYVLLSTQTEPTAAAQFTLTLDSTGTYSEQIFVLAGWYQVNLVDTYLRTVEGGSVVSGSSTYQYNFQGTNNAANPGIVGSNGQTYIRTNWYSTGDSANETNDLILRVRNADSSTQRTMIHFQHYGLAGNASMTYNIGNGRRASAAVATAIQLTSSNASSNYVFANGGYIKHYGVK